MQKSKFLIVALLALTLCTFFIARTLLAPNGANTLLYGNVDIREVDMAFRQSGRLTQLFWEEGDKVQQGTVLGEIDATPFEERRDEARALLHEASANFERLKNGSRPQEIGMAEAMVKQTDAALVFAESELARQQSVVHTGASTRQSLDQSRLSLDQAKAQSVSARQDLSMRREGSRSEDIDAALARLESARAGLREAETALEDCKLIAPSSGTIMARVKEPGSMVGPSSPVYTISLTHPSYVRAYVSETELAEARPGREVTLSCDSCRNTYHGTIGFVSPRAEFTPKSVETTDLRTDLVYRLRITVNDADEALRHGMPVTIQLAKEP